MKLHCWYKGNHFAYTLRSDNIPLENDELHIKCLGRLRIYHAYTGEDELYHVCANVIVPSFSWEGYQKFRQLRLERRRKNPNGK